MQKQNHMAGIPITLGILTLMPLTASAENYNEVGAITLIAIGVYLVLIFGGAFCCCFFVHKKTGQAMTWLLFPLWACAIYSAMIALGLLARMVHGFFVP